MPSTTAGVKIEIALDHRHHADTLRRVVKPARYERSQRLFTGVTERRVPEIVPEGDGVDERLDQTESAPHFAGNGAHLERVRETGANQRVAGTRDHLRLAREAAKGTRTQKAVSVTKIAGFDGCGLHTEHPYNLGPFGASCRRLGSDILRQELLALVSAFLASPVLALVARRTVGFRGAVRLGRRLALLLRFRFDFRSFLFRL